MNVINVPGFLSTLQGLTTVFQEFPKMETISLTNQSPFDLFLYSQIQIPTIKVLHSSETK